MIDMATKKDYDKIARGFYCAFVATNPKHHGIVRHAAMCVAQQLENDNPRFDIDTFMETCEPR